MKDSTSQAILALYSYTKQFLRKWTNQANNPDSTSSIKRKYAGKSRWIVLISVLSLCLISVTAPAQENEREWKLPLKELHRQLRDLYRAPEFATMQVDQYFACGLNNISTGNLSSLWHYLKFQNNRTLQLSIELNNRQWITGNGVYTAFLVLGIINYQINMTYVLAGQTYRTDFDLRNVLSTFGLRMIRFFDAEGELTENGATSSIEMYCQAVGHDSNSTSDYRRFVCPSQDTPTGYEVNVFEFNALVPGNAFRQRDSYTDGISAPSIERSEFGMYRQNSNDITMDFNVNPILALNDFSDYNELNAHLVQSGSQWQLVVDEFPPGENICEEVSP